MSSYVIAGFVLVLILIAVFCYLKFWQQEKEAEKASVLSYDFAYPQKILAKGKKIMILAPHSDDETLMCAGIIAHSLANGAEVKVVLVTNGDHKGRKMAFTRTKETLAAMACLGLEEKQIIFLGYGDTGKESDSFLNRLYQAATDTTLVPSDVGNETYCLPGIREYHYQKFGVHGRYDRATFRSDLEAVIQEFGPDHIFVSSLYETHPDHAMLYKFTVASVIALKRRQPDFSPMLHAYLVHSQDSDDVWPTRDPRRSPLVPFPKPATWDTATLLDWEKREVFTVPLAMQRLPRSKNLKYITISKYRSQRPSRNHKYLYSYVKKDEVFWQKDFSNIAFLAAVTVSSENTLNHQLGMNAVDGLIDGAPRFPGHAWATVGETAGAWIRLSWPHGYTVNRIVLYGHPDPESNITGAMLAFSDGSSLPVGALPANGSGHEIAFAPKTIEWVQFTVDAAKGKYTGLSELEVYEAPEI